MCQLDAVQKMNFIMLSLQIDPDRAFDKATLAFEVMRTGHDFRCIEKGSNGKLFKNPFY